MNNRNQEAKERIGTRVVNEWSSGKKRRHLAVQSEEDEDQEVDSPTPEGNPVSDDNEIPAEPTVIPNGSEEEPSAPESDVEASAEEPAAPQPTSEGEGSGNMVTADAQPKYGQEPKY